jgi:hypothetical protein
MIMHELHCLFGKVVLIRVVVPRAQSRPLSSDVKRERRVPMAAPCLAEKHRGAVVRRLCARWKLDTMVGSCSSGRPG